MPVFPTASSRIGIVYHTFFVHTSILREVYSLFIPICAAVPTKNAVSLLTHGIISRKTSVAISEVFTQSDIFERLYGKITDRIGA